MMTIDQIDMNLTIDQIRELANLTPADVLCVYSGKPGCACGCRGNYHYNSARKSEAAERRGYALNADEVSDEQVAHVLRLVQQAVIDMPENVWAFDDGFVFEDDEYAYSVHLR